jgi:sulfur-oxidizing protein SoxX
MKRKIIKHFISALIFSGVLVTVADAATGKELAENRKKGNCLACHMITGANLPGNIAPPLVAMKERFPNKADLRAQIFDARVANPNTFMIPFGPHEVMSAKEIDKVVDYIYSL